jgi:hypothetical protein
MELIDTVGNSMIDMKVKIDPHAAGSGTAEGMKKLLYGLLCIANTGRRRGQHPERTYASNQKSERSGGSAANFV